MIDGSGNIFADIGVDQPEEAEAKAQVVDAIARLLDRRKITEQEAGKLVHLNKQQISCLMRGDTRKFSYEHLMRVLTALGQDDEAVVLAVPGR